MARHALNFDRVRIRATGHYVPATVYTNEELERKVETSAEWIRNTLGVCQRHIAGPEEYSSDLAAQAGLEAIGNAGLDRNDIEMILVATATPDRKSPSTACLAQQKMGITNRCPAMDIGAVCSGFLYSMTVAAQFIQSGAYERILVIGADTFSKITDWTRRDCVFFGDGAGAVVVERRPEGGGLFSSMLFADGAGADNFTVYPHDRTFTMNAHAVYQTATEVIPQAAREILRRHDIGIEDVKVIIPHQPSLRVLKRTAELLEVPFEKVQTNLAGYANTAGATIPLLLHQVNQAGALSTGDLVLFAAVGSGWTWATALYRWI